MWVVLLLAAWAAVLPSCGRLCRAAAAAAAITGTTAGDRAPAPPLTLYETAYLAGGPQRVTDLLLTAMSRRRRLLLAHTGWATVIDPDGQDDLDDLERSLIRAIGPDGQSPVSRVRAEHRRTAAMTALADRLTAAGLAVPAQHRREQAAAVGQMRGACALVLATGAAAVLTLPPGEARGQAAGWFALPLVLTAGCLALALFDAPPHTRWASPAGQRLLAEAATRPRTTDAEQDVLILLAIRGHRAVADPGLRAALATRPHRQRI
ncbi:TIGR04222 domain-containing membrane protein [Streptomyces orinoci]|uniref:TIGR04222 domain-containing membrane protein n=1 Tax=Streptomyces orinoci TaxID=67339 RepID=A0ABV3K797_STRON|nr:TIGR04222 domain-containing membrane protein [Streptomyces orinoci]